MCGQRHAETLGSLPEGLPRGIGVGPCGQDVRQENRSKPQARRALELGDRCLDVAEWEADAGREPVEVLLELVVDPIIDETCPGNVDLGITLRGERRAADQDSTDHTIAIQLVHVPLCRGANQCLCTAIAYESPSERVPSSGSTLIPCSKRAVIPVAPPDSSASRIPSGICSGRTR